MNNHVSIGFFPYRGKGSLAIAIIFALLRYLLQQPAGFIGQAHPRRRRLLGRNQVLAGFGRAALAQEHGPQIKVCRGIVRFCA